MVDVPVYNMAGEQTGTMQIDEAILGGRLRPKLMKQAVVAHLAAQRQGSARTRSRGMVAGSTRKLYRQKGTGNARTGAIRTPVKTGGGVTFAKTARDFRHAMPKKARRLARNSAILARIQGNDALILDPFEMSVPKTRELAKALASVGAGTGCVLALGQPSDAVYKSSRNLQKIEVRLVGDLCAYDVLRRKKLVFTKSAFELLLANPVSLRAAE
ncbi:MAG: 50S ribosomal protein L4, partial [Phycisphaerae bacterium]|nr:50S ribosomal protein L4 [Phycisphaerae bacterium]